MSFLIDDLTSRDAWLDAATHAQIGITQAHHTIHRGSAFQAFLQDSSVASGNKISFAFKTADSDKLIHLVLELRSTGEALTALIEGATFPDDDGSETIGSVFNKQRDSGGATSIFENQTTGLWDTVGIVAFPQAVTTAKHPSSGVLIDCYVTGSGKQTGGAARGTAEWILARDTVYAFVMESKSATNSMILKVEFYEHLVKD